MEFDSGVGPTCFQIYHSVFNIRHVGRSVRGKNSTRKRSHTLHITLTVLLNTKRDLCNSCFLRYMQNSSFGKMHGRIVDEYNIPIYLDSFQNSEAVLYSKETT